MLRPLRFQRFRLSVLKKPNGLNRQQEEAQFDKYNGNSIWVNGILKELESYVSISLFKMLLSSTLKSRAERYQFAPLQMIFYIKLDLRGKSRLVIGGHVVDLSGHEVYAITMKYVSPEILMTIASENDLEVITGDIGNA